MSRLRRFSLIAVIILLFAAGLEGSYRLYLRISGTPDISLVKFRELLEQSHIKPHPYLVYVLRPNAEFPIQWLGTNGPVCTVNSFGFRSSLEYDISIAKPPNSLRIAVLGGSTTMGANADNEVWPYLTARNLATHFSDKKIEVLNEGVMGYSTLDNLIDLAIRVIDFDSDIYILYLGLNDHLTAAPLNLYRSDNSHFRRTLYENVSFSPVELIPDWLLKSSVIKRVLFLFGAQDRRDLLNNTTTGLQMYKLVSERDEVQVMGAVRKTALRNIRSMIGIIRANNPGGLIILSSLYHREDPKRIKDMNSAFRELAEASGVMFVDVANGLPRSAETTYDNIHFTKVGEEDMAEFFSKAIINAIDNGWNPPRS